MNWVKIFLVDVLLSADFIKSVSVKGKRLCTVKTADQIYVVQSRCPHAGADLSQGFCKDKKLICAFHRYEYDLTTGRGAPGQGDYINVYPLEQREDGLYIGFKERWSFIKKLFDL